MDDQKMDDKEKIMYEAYANNWFNSAMEFDKQLLWLSAGGIALLLNDNVGLALNYQATLFFMSLLLLSLTIISVLVVYKLNRRVLEARMSNDKVKEKLSNKSIKCWDKTALISMAIGMISLIVYFIV